MPPTTYAESRGISNWTLANGPHVGTHAACGGVVTVVHLGDRVLLVCAACQRQLEDSAEVLREPRIPLTSIRRLLADGPEGAS